jgi:molybdate transport system ATP-binding protein
MLEVSIQKRRGDFTLDAAFRAPTPGVVALFGRSGCGKTTLVGVIAGLLEAEKGHVGIDGELWLDTTRGIDVAAERRRAGYVFQDARLFPHYSVRGNLLYGARRSRDAPTVIGFDEVVELLGLGALLDRRPGSLSGGEKQRVALGRALLAQPRLLLLDEPLSSLDAARREEVLPYLERLRDHCAIPMILVSHQFDEVLRLATHVVVMDAGRVVAQGSVTAVSLTPALRAIVGSEAIGAVVDGVVRRIDAGLAEVTVGDGLLRVHCAHAVPGMAMRVQVLARDIILATQEPTGLSVRNRLRGTVRAIADDAGYDLVYVDVGDAPLLARVTRDATRELALAPGKSVWVLVKAVSTQGHAFASPAGVATTTGQPA